MTFVVIDGWTITVASVGDSRCILDTQGGVVSLLTVDHRLEENEEERQRVTASGGEVGRLNVFGGNEVKSYQKFEIVFLIIATASEKDILMFKFTWFIGWTSALLAWWVVPFKVYW